jgi:hypothetical protein
MRGSHRLCATAIRGVAKLLLVLRRIILDNFELQGCTAPAQKAATACLLLLLLEADVDHFISPSSLDIIYIDVYAHMFVLAHALRIFLT